MHVPGADFAAFRTGRGPASARAGPAPMAQPLLSTIAALTIVRSSRRIG
jgi:hypothetical protein